MFIWLLFSVVEEWSSQVMYFTKQLIPDNIMLIIFCTEGGPKVRSVLY